MAINNGDEWENDATEPLFLTIDQGGHASRVLVFDRGGNKVIEARQSVDVSFPKENWVEQDADALAMSVQTALLECLQKLGARRQNIVTAGLVTQRSNIVCLDRQSGRALSPAISWQDRRAYSWMQTFELHTDKIRHVTGLLPSAHYGASKIHWCLEHLEEVEAARQQSTLACGPLASFLLFRLLKEKPFVVDSVNASRTLLWDRQTQHWSDELLGLFALNAGYLPRCVPNQHAFGRLVFDEFSPPLSIPLTVCSGDQSAALFSLGMPKENHAYLNMGTGAFMQCITAQKESLPARLLKSTVWHESGELLQVMEATVNGAGSALSMMAAELGISQQQVQNESENWLTMVENIPIYLNGVSGLGSPYWQPNFGSRFVNDDAESTKPEAKLVAVIESILFLLKVNLDELNSEGIEVRHIVISGGFSVLNELCQRLADVSSLPVVRPKQSEATAKGLAFLLVKSWVKSVGGPTVTWGAENIADHFSPQENITLIKRYQRWRTALDVELNAELNS